jgi:hypothetical protein
MTHRYAPAIALAFLLAPAAAWSQAVPAEEPRGVASARPDPADASAPVPPLVVRSALGAHRGMTDETLGSWREANDTVGRIGGWRTYAKEAEPAAPNPGGHSHGTR